MIHNTATKLRQVSEDERRENIKRAERCRIAFDDTLRYRTERQRNFKYVIGDQWHETMEDPDTGETITEEQFIRKQGRIPAQQNLVGKTVRNLAGQFRTNYPDPVAFGRSRAKAQAGEMMTSALQYALDINEANELDAQALKEFTIGARTGWKIGFKWWDDLNREDIYVKNIDPTRIFYNVDANDIRGHDIRMIGELHDMSLKEVISKFGFSWKDKDELMKHFPHSAMDHWEINNFAQHVSEYRQFYIADNPDQLRVIEMWDTEYADRTFLHDTKDGSFEPVSKQFFIDAGYDAEIVDKYSLEEIVQLLNEARLENAVMQGINPDAVPMFELVERYEEVWRAYFLTPDGHELLSMDTPYKHGSHPYAFGQYMIDGKPLPLVSSIYDQQRHVNRLISMIDASIGRSLKKVMMVPLEAVPPQYSGDLQAYSDDMVQMNGFAFYVSNNGQNPMPKEVSSKAVPADAMNLLTLQSELLKDISAVNDAVQGKQPQSGTPASLYAQQTLNASITNKDMFDFFFSMIRRRNRKIVQVIKQFYTEPRYIKISGTGFNAGVDSQYDPDEVKDVDFDVVIGESQNTLAYRQTVDAELKEFLGAQMITFEEYLDTTSMPYADKLLQIIRNRQEKQQEQAGDMQIPGDPQQQQQMVAQMQQQGNNQN